MIQPEFLENHDEHDDSEFSDLDFKDNFIDYVMAGFDIDDIDDEEISDEDFDEFLDDFEQYGTYSEQSIVSDTSYFDGFTFSKTDNNFKIKNDFDMFAETYYMSIHDMRDQATFDSFIKSCENKIRRSSVYKAYIAYLKDEIGLTRDVFNGEISHDVASLEMHHGPIFTLYDYVRIMIDYCFDTGLPISDFSIAKLIMDEHAANNIQVVMLTKTNHSLVHGGKLHVDFRQCHGNIKRFIDKYRKWIYASPRLVKKIQGYKSLIDNDKFRDISFIIPKAPIDWSKMKISNNKQSSLQ